MSGRLGSVAAGLLLVASIASAETIDFGGHGEKFKGEGDKIPPECQVSYPSASAEPFFIKWNCIDDNAERQDIRTELWIFRKGSGVSELLVSFLGFPAFAQIDAAVLRSQTLADGLPAAFRLVAVDRAGITAISPLLTVLTQDNSVTRCSMELTTEATESTGDTTGQPASQVVLNDVPVTTRQIDGQNFEVATAAPAAADTCEVEDICSDGDKVAFRLSLKLGEQNSASGNVSISPGNVLAQVTGDYTASGVLLNSVSVSGTTTIGETNAEVAINCEK